jgi:multidrug efflux system outer membrane protein
MKNRSVCLLVFLAGCAVGPDYKKPELETPAQWRVVDYPAAADAANTLWWKQFNDPVLDALIDTALRENLDIQAASARVDQFIGALTSTRSQYFPQLGYNAEASRNRASRLSQLPLPNGTDSSYNLYQGALTADWQLDLFGRVRRQSEAAQAQVLASTQGRRGVILTLVASVSASYVTLRGLDRQLEIAQATAKNYAGTVDLFALRRRGGVVSALELAQARSQYEAAVAAIPSLEVQVASTENLISILLGRNPGPIPRGRTIDELASPAIPGGLPSTLLERRPDILEAEQALVAANANIGVAKSLYFPTLSLTGLLGAVSTAAGDFFTSGARTAAIAAGVTGPLFTFGGIRGQVDTAEAGQRAALIFYRQTVLNAFRETNDALYGAQKKREEYEALARRVAALREYARLSRARFDGGAASYLEVLYAENELFNGELSAVSSHIQQHTQVINVYQALGGGWLDEADPVTPQPALVEKPKPQ